MIHGGNGAWPRQQIASDLLRSDAIQPAILDVAFGRDGIAPAEASDAEIVRRLEAIEAREAKAMGIASKVLHAMAPARWPPLTPRATPEVGEELGFPIPVVAKPADYPAFAEAMRELMRAKEHADLCRADMLVADTWEMLQAE